MKISRLIEKLALIQVESGDREIVLSNGGEDFEIVAVASPFLVGDEGGAPVLLELQAIDERMPGVSGEAGREDLALRVA